MLPGSTRAALCSVVSFAVVLVALTCGRVAAQPSPDEPYPLSLALRTLQQDLSSPEYERVLPTMIYTDLAAEWQRVATPDNYYRFALQHGGRDKVLADPQLKRAYELRLQIANQFLDRMRAAYKKLNLTPPFEDEAVLQQALASVDQKGSAAPLASGSVTPILPAEGSQQQWPAFRGPGGQGIVIESSPATGLVVNWPLQWKVPLPGRGNSSPVVWGDAVFVTAEVTAESDAALRDAQKTSGPQRLLLCYDRGSGALRWQYAAPSAPQLEKLYWKNSYASATPVTDGQRVVAFFGSSGMVCCDFSGKPLWHADLGVFSTTHGPGASPVMYEDLVILMQDQNQGESVCVALDKHTGKVRWKRERPQNMGWSTPVLIRVAGRDELIYNGSHEVVSYDPKTGELLWSVAGTSQEAIPMIVSGGGLLFSTSGRNGPTMAIRPGGQGDVTATHLVWRKERGGPHVTSPTYVQGWLYLVSDTGVLTCLEATTGETVYQQRLRGRFSASPLVLDGRLLLVSEDGLGTEVRVGQQFESLGELDLGEFTVATPAVLDGQVFFRTEKHLWCLGQERP